MKYLSIASIARGEAPYLKEWLTYHLGIGVDHIYVYNNDIEPSLQSKICKLFGDRVTEVSFPGDVRQLAMTEHVLKTLRRASRWIAFIDVDEFLVPYKTNNVKEVLKNYEAFPALCVHWRLFGSSGERTYRDLPVIERFTRRATEVDRHVKSIVDPTRTGRWVTVHKYTHTGSAVDEHRRKIPETESRPEPASADIIGINHYVTKSLEECTERRSRLRADINAKHEMPSFFAGHDRNDVEDLRALELWRSINHA